ncbi:MAG: Mg2+ and Co2+ transporter CorB [Clostridium sp.]|nr:Mg2+ and Co2+ transporter CorB [Clostridium sp.]
MEDNFKQSINGRKIKFRRNIMGNKKENPRWIVIIILLTFFLSSSLSVASSILLKDINLFISILLVILIVLIGIVFDVIGIAVTAADEAPFHAMASRKLYGAKQSIKLIRNANKVSSVCNDVVGDICGVISGTSSALIVVKIARTTDGFLPTVIGLCFTGFIASLTIGGKAVGKTLAIKNSSHIVYKVGIVLELIFGNLQGWRSKTNKR